MVKHFAAPLTTWKRNLWILIINLALLLTDLKEEGKKADTQSIRVATIKLMFLHASCTVHRAPRILHQISYPIMCYNILVQLVDLFTIRLFVVENHINLVVWSHFSTVLHVVTVIICGFFSLNFSFFSVVFKFLLLYSMCVCVCVSTLWYLLDSVHILFVKWEFNWENDKRCCCFFAQSVNIVESVNYVLVNVGLNEKMAI